MFPNINRSRQNDFESKHCVTLPNSSKIEFTMFKESMKIEKQRKLMKNMLKNQIEQDRKIEVHNHFLKTLGNRDQT